jgi:hypothetical protein
MNFIKRLINYFKAKKIRKELMALNAKYYFSIEEDWKRKGYARNVYCFPIETSNIKHTGRVSFLKGLELVLKNGRTEKHIILNKIPLTVKNLVKEYVKLYGFSDEFVKSTEDFTN